MKRMVLGVIAVFVVQAGFIGYTSLERRSDEVVAANGVVADSGPLADDPVIVSDLDPSRPNLNSLPGDRIGTNLVAYVPERRLRRPSSAAHPLIARSTRPLVSPTTAIFEPRIILVPTAETRRGNEHPGTIANASRLTGSPAISKPAGRAEKRSFAAKSVAVLKKPYDWLKAVASRMR